VLSSSKSDAKQDARFSARLDVLLERVDTLASTVATTASAMAKKDGEITALQRALEAHDQTLRALVQHVNRAAEAPAADAPVDATELRSLRNAVAALTKERAEGVNASRMGGLVASVRALGERVDDLAAAAAAVPSTDPAVTARIDELASDLAALRTSLEQGLAEAARPPEELAAMLTTLRTEVEVLGELRPAVDAELDRRFGDTNEAVASSSRLVDQLTERIARLERTRTTDDERHDRRLGAMDGVIANASLRIDQLTEAVAGLERTRAVDEERPDRRFDRMKDSLADLSHRLDALPGFDEKRVDRRFTEVEDTLVTFGVRLDALAQSVESAASSLGHRKDEVAALHRQYTDSSARIESIVDDIREALHAYPDVSDASLDEVTARLERLETSMRKAGETSVRAAGELSGRIDVIDRRVATVAEEVSRAKTLWPVALRSLEARLDDAVTAHGPERGAEDGSPTDGRGELSHDRLAGLRDSLQEMESVAEEMARASETLGGPGEVSAPDVPADETHEDEAAPAEPETPAPSSTPAAASAGGATIVPLRSGEP
jgi:chromosome segregation ATPase